MDTQEPTPEQIAKYEAQMTERYEKALPFLRIQHEYETKSAEVMEARLRMRHAQQRIAEWDIAESDAIKERQKEKAPKDASNKNK